jgi:uncharacterized SAM-dependent methyltransferase
VTGAFNLNLLTRIDRELGGSFDLKAFHHRACLVSLAKQKVRAATSVRVLSPQHAPSTPAGPLRRRM